MINSVHNAWRLAPDSLPVVPTFLLKQDDGTLDQIYGIIRGPRSGPDLWLTFGCNITVVPEFCGGLFMTSANVIVNQYQAIYANQRQRDVWAKMLSTDDLFPWDEAVTALAPIAPGEWSRWHGHPNLPERLVDTALALEKIGALSLGMRMAALSLSARRRSINFWDTKYGPTRGIMRWIYYNTAGGVFYPDTFIRYTGLKRKALEQAAFDKPISMGTDGFIHRAYPAKFVTGMYLMNNNSGNRVATSTLYMADVKRPSRPNDVMLERGAPKVHVTKANHDDAFFHLGSGFTPVPTRFYSM